MTVKAFLIIAIFFSFRIFVSCTCSQDAVVNYYLSSRSIDYTLTTFEWDKTNPLKETIDNPKHKMEKLEYGFGVYFRDK